MFLASDDSYADVTGSYVYGIGFAAAAAAVGGFGVDRVLARRIAAGELSFGLPLVVVKFRFLEFVSIVLPVMLLAILVPDVALLVCSCAAFVVTRIIYADLESIWIARARKMCNLAVALTLNGLVSGGVAVIGGISGSAPLMIVGSAAGNLLGTVVLTLSARRLSTREVPADIVGECRGVAGSLWLSVLYSRVDLLLLAMADTPAQAVAYYGIVTRAFDALLIVRGSLSQQEARDVARLDEVRRMRELTAWVPKLYLLLTPAVLLASAAVIVFGVLRSVDGLVFLIVGLGVLSVPLFFSHMATSAIIFSNRRTHVLFLCSVLSCGFSVLIKFILIFTLDVLGAVLAIGLVEFASAAVFLVGYGGRGRVLVKTLLPPVVSFLMVGGFLVAGYVAFI